jgi:hypothetical protein
MYGTGEQALFSGGCRELPPTEAFVLCSKPAHIGQVIKRSDQENEHDEDLDDVGFALNLMDRLDRNDVEISLGIVVLHSNVSSGELLVMRAAGGGGGHLRRSTVHTYGDDMQRYPHGSFMQGG